MYINSTFISNILLQLPLYRTNIQSTEVLTDCSKSHNLESSQPSQLAIRKSRITATH